MKTVHIISTVIICMLLSNVNVIYGHNISNFTDEKNENVDDVELIDLKHRKFYIGYTLGINAMDLSAKTVNDIGVYGFDNISPRRGFGFSLGLVSNLALSNSYDLRFIPSITFSSRGLDYSLVNGHNGFHELGQDWEVTFLEFPLLVKYSFDSGRKRNPYLIAGINYSHDLMSPELGVGDEILIRTKRNDVFGELGVGIERPLTYFVFGLELKASIGLTDIKSPGEEFFPEYYIAINHLRARKVALSITIE